MQYPDISYKSIDTLPYYNFVEVLKTGNLKWIGEQEDVETVWLSIQDEYYKASKLDNSDIRQQAKVIGLIKKYEFISGCLEVLRHSYLLRDFDEFKENLSEVKKVLSKFGYLVDGRKEFAKELDRLKTQLSGLKTKIDIESGKIEKNNKKQGISLWKELVYLEKAVQGIKIDPYKDPVAKVIEVKNLAKEIQDEQRNNRLNRSR